MPIDPTLANTLTFARIVALLYMNFFFRHALIRHLQSVSCPSAYFYRSRTSLVTGETGTELRVSDAALIARIVQRDESALATLYDRYAGMLSSVLNRILRDTQAAEEILQDIFYQLWRTAGQFDASRGSLPGWLLVIARNRAISRLRRHNPASGEELLENTVVLPINLESSIAQQQMVTG